MPHVEGKEMFVPPSLYINKSTKYLLLRLSQSKVEKHRIVSNLDSVRTNVLKVQFA